MSESPCRTAPRIEDGLTWINELPQPASALQGRVQLLFFFDCNSPESIRAFPYLKKWEERYAPLGLTLIGVHVPEYDFSLDPIHVHAAVKRNKLTFPIVTDSNYTVVKAYRVAKRPAFVLVDAAGIIREERASNRKADEAIDRAIQRLLREQNPNLRLPAVMPVIHGVDKPDAVCFPVSPAVYLGRSQSPFGNLETSSTNDVPVFSLPGQLDEGRVYASGAWSVLETSVRHALDADGMSDCLAIRYRAVYVDVVMRPEDIYWKLVHVQQDGKWIPRDIAGSDIKFDPQGRSYIEVRHPRLYNVIAGQPYGKHELRLFTQGKGLSVYAFHFGTAEIPVGESRLQPAR